MILDEASLDLQTAGIGTRATDLFESFLPESPDAAIAIFDNAGSPPIQTLGADVSIERPRLTVWARATTAALAAEKIRAVYARWRAKSEAQMTKAAGGTTRWLSVMAVGSPFLLKRDDASPPRTIYAINFDVLKEISTG